MTNKIPSLLTRVEETLGQKICPPRDFDALSQSIYTSTHIRISSSTLKRMWGYVHDVPNYAPRSYTLHALAQYIGYKDFDTFLMNLDESNAEVDSDFICNQQLCTDNLPVNTRIRLLWEPNRCLTIRLQENGLFIIEESINSKLAVGDTFCCSHFVWNEPLYLHSLTHGEFKNISYACGRNGGIKFYLISNQEEDI